MPLYNGNEPGSPDWWLHDLVQKLMDQQGRYDVLEDYHLGNHDLPHVNPEHISAVRHFQEMARTNYIKLVNDAPVARMSVKDFTFGSGKDPDGDAKKIWSANDMALQSKKLHMASAIFGDGYLLVGPPDLETGLPTMTVQDPRIAIVEPDPQFPTKSLAGLRMWEDGVAKKTIAVLYLPGSISVYTCNMVNSASGMKTDITQRLLGHTLGYGFQLQAEYPNPLGEVPLVHFEWQPDYNNLSLGEAEMVLHIQDRINQMILDRLVTANSQAFQKIFATGVTPAEDKKGGPKKGPTRPPWELGPNHMWVAGNEKANFGAIPAVDFKQMLEATQDDIADMAAITQTPGHYLMGRIANVSGDTLTQAESGFASKTRLRMEAMGWGWERAMRLAFKYMGDRAKAMEPEVTVIWANPIARKDVDAADAASKWTAAGVELGLVMDQFGEWSSEQITFNREHVEEMKAQEQEMAQKQLDIAATKAEQKPAPAAVKKPASKKA